MRPSSLLSFLMVAGLCTDFIESEFKPPREIPPKSMPRKRSHKQMNRNRRRKNK